MQVSRLAWLPQRRPVDGRCAAQSPDRWNYHHRDTEIQRNLEKKQEIKKSNCFSPCLCVSAVKSVQVRSAACGIPRDDACPAVPTIQLCLPRRCPQSEPT